MIFSLQGKKVVITGGGSGIGRAISLLFAEQGAEIHIFDLDNPVSAETKEAVKSISPTSNLHVVDITKPMSIDNAIKSIGSIDILINNAGIAQIGTLETTSEEDFQRIFDVNVKGAFHCMKAIIPGMVAQNKGHI